MPLIMEFVKGRLPPDLYHAYLTPLFETWSDVLLETSPAAGHVLDIACGTGIVSRKLATCSAVESVEAIDIADPMINKAKMLTGSELPVRYQTASAESLPFVDDQFSAAYCQQGLQFFPDKVAALKEAARVVEPGGKIAFAVWTPAKDGNPVFGAFEDIVARKLGEDLVPFGPFSFGDPDKLERMARSAGLSVNAVERLEQTVPLSDVCTLVLFDLLFLGRPGADGQLQPLFDPQDASKDDLIESIISDLSHATRSYQDTDGALLAPTTANILVAEVPT